MSCIIPNANDIRKYLRGYCVNLLTTVTLKGDVADTSAIISNIDTRDLETLMGISGIGIPTGATIVSIDVVGVIGQITISAPATATNAQTDLVIEFYTEMTDEWISNRRDNFVIPYIENATGLTINQISEIEEYHSGNGSSILMLNKRPAIEVTNLTYTNIPAETQTGNLLLSVELIKEEGILKSKSNFNEGSFDPIFAKGTNNIKVKYTYGFAEPPCDIAEAVTTMMAKKILMQIGARTGGGSISQSSYARNFGPRGKYTDIINLWDQEIYSILRKYTSSVVGQ